MSKLSRLNCLVSVFTLFALGVTTNGYSGDFSDDKDYQRQQEQADKAFEELEKIDGSLPNKPAPVTPSPETMNPTKDSTPALTPIQTAPLPVSAPVVVKKEPPPPVSNKIHAAKTGSGITFEFDSCVKTESEVACHFNLTSQGGDREILFGSSDNSVVVISDDLGNQYRFYKVKVGNQEQFNPYRFSAPLAADSPTRATFSFGGIPSQAQSIATLEINSAANKTGEWEKFTLEFAVLPFTMR
ncbi:hypothetical protein MNBD_GAMMA18-1239 [hydrothermal vent metagenome]|uniref:Uncharacterized protein n=1 Tax=hydrothermal vent metagenome TaxID=652676 RepID=A0A3B0Z5V6_9ZZZZ